MKLANAWTFKLISVFWTVHLKCIQSLTNYACNWSVDLFHIKGTSWCGFRLPCTLYIKKKVWNMCFSLLQFLLSTHSNHKQNGSGMSLMIIQIGFNVLYAQTISQLPQCMLYHSTVTCSTIVIANFFTYHCIYHCQEKWLVAYSRQVSTISQLFD